MHDPQCFTLSIRLRCGTWAPGDVGTNGMKDIKKHLHDFCQIMCQFAGESRNSCKLFWKKGKLQMTVETKVCLHGTDAGPHARVSEMHFVHTGPTSKTLSVSHQASVFRFVRVTVLQGWVCCTRNHSFCIYATDLGSVWGGAWFMWYHCCDTKQEVSSREGPQYHRGVPLTFMS